MGAAVELAQFALNLAYGGWLRLALLSKLGIFALLCILGVATFAFAAKILGIINLLEISKNLLKKGKTAC